MAGIDLSFVTREALAAHEPNLGDPEAVARNAYHQNYTEDEALHEVRLALYRDLIRWGRCYSPDTMTASARATVARVYAEECAAETEEVMP